MRKIFFLFISFLIVSPFFASASCAGPFTLQEYKDAADIVAVGKVQSQSNGVATVEVEKYYKGSSQSLITVSGRGSDEPSALSSIDFEFEAGETYLLFLREMPAGIYKTNDCSGSQLLLAPLTKKQQQVLGEGSQPPADDQGPNRNPFLYIGLAALSAGVAFWLARRRAPVLN